VYVAGSTSGTLPGQADRGRLDAYVRAYATDGTGRWTRQFGTQVTDSGTTVSADATGIYVGGETNGRFGHQTDRGSTDLYIRKFSPGGDGRWTTQFGSGRSDKQWWSDTDGAGTLSIAGDTNGAMPTQNTLGGGRDAFVAQVS
jgi:hypothetical protein